MTVFYPNPCYNEECKKGTALYQNLLLNYPILFLGQLFGSRTSEMLILRDTEALCQGERMAVNTEWAD